MLINDIIWGNTGWFECAVNYKTLHSIIVIKNMLLIICSFTITDVFILFEGNILNVYRINFNLKNR